MIIRVVCGIMVRNKYYHVLRHCVVRSSEYPRIRTLTWSSEKPSPFHLLDELFGCCFITARKNHAREATNATTVCVRLCNITHSPRSSLYLVIPLRVLKQNELQHFVVRRALHAVISSNTVLCCLRVCNSCACMK